MSLSERVGPELPYLRRYARALTGSQSSGDAYVREMLEAALADEALLQQLAGGRVPLYAAFTRIWASSHVEVGLERDGTDHETIAASRLSRIPAPHRQALLLTTVEEFSPDQAGQVLGIDAEEVDALVARAIEEIESQTATDVLIIEDEPLISMNLESLVSELGHIVAGTATTRTEAVELFEKLRPGLVLADIQLADGSSGIDAVEDILRMADVPVIFITAYPERLLTGERPEPTYLVTKPFREEAVRAAISQALFFS